MSNALSSVVSYSSPVGELAVECAEGVILSLFIGDVPAAYPSTHNDSLSVDEKRPPVELFKLFDRYFAGEELDFEGVEVSLDATPFQLSVWQALRKIPYGRVVTYGELASDIGSNGGARAVGTACAKNPLPIIIPCHRVVSAGGALGGYSAGDGTQVKRRLLALEGVVI